MSNLKNIGIWLWNFLKNNRKKIIFGVLAIAAFTTKAYWTGFLEETGKQDASDFRTRISANPPDTAGVEGSSKHSLNRKEENTKGNSNKIPDKIPIPKKLHDYFKEDFQNYFSTIRPIGITVSNVGGVAVNKSYNIECRLLYTFDSAAKFFSVYVPTKTYPHTVQVIGAVAEHYDEILQTLEKDFFMSGSLWDKRYTEPKELTFTKRIYIYNNAYLENNEKDNLRIFFQKKGLSPRFRGSGYLQDRYEAERISAKLAK